MDSRYSIDVSKIPRHTRLVVARKRKSGWGGVRPGAGRKRIVKEPKRFNVDFEEPDLDALRELAERRGTSAADLIRRAVAQYLRRAGRD